LTRPHVYQASSAGDFSVILHTTNGGVRWRRQAVSPAVALYGIFFLNGSHGWAVGASSTILFTASGGANWQHSDHGCTSDPTVTLRGVVVDQTSGSGYVVGGRREICRSLAGGRTWTQHGRSGFGGIDLFAVAEWGAADLDPAWPGEG
jgi:photosystem II stability/assembly factor-like uncharacterized protein